MELCHFPQTFNIHLLWLKQTQEVSKPTKSNITLIDFSKMFQNSKQFTFLINWKMAYFITTLEIKIVEGLPAEEESIPNKCW